MIENSRVAEKTVTHFGMADASSAIPIGEDKFLVVSDEKNVFQLYDRNQSGPYIEQIPFYSMIEVDSKKDEADIEGSATLGDITYWIGSHGRDKNGALARSRHQLFATLVKDKGDYVRIKQVGSSYTGLLYDLILKTDFRSLTVEDLNAQPDGTKSSKEFGAVSIEGLTIWKNGLLIGFRNPIPDNKALLVPVLNPLELVLYGSHCEFGEFIYLDLDGLGIRSIDYWAERGIYVIVAGAYDQQDNFSYYSWSGKPSERPRQLAIPEAADLHPEAIVFFDGSPDGMLILSDDGRAAKANENGELQFRSKWISL